jgi:hypothetical protein
MTYLTAITAREERWAASLIEAFAPSRPERAATTGAGRPTPPDDVASRADGAPSAAPVPLVPRPGEVDWAAAYRTLLARATPLARLGLRLALLVAVVGPALCWRRFVLAPSLPLRDRTRLLGELLASRSYLVRELVLLLKVCAAFALFRTPGPRARSRYDGPSAVMAGGAAAAGAAAGGASGGGAASAHVADAAAAEPRSDHEASGERPRVRLPVAAEGGPGGEGLRSGARHAAGAVGTAQGAREEEAA